MALAEQYTISSVSVSTGELSIVSGTTALQTITDQPGVYQLLIDAANMAKGDTFVIRVYERVLSGGTKRVVATWTLQGTQAELFVTPAMHLRNGFDFTIQRTAGADRTFSASVRRAY